MLIVLNSLLEVRLLFVALSFFHKRHGDVLIVSAYLLLTPLYNGWGYILALSWR